MGYGQRFSGGLMPILLGTADSGDGREPETW